ncbi:MAG TPA: hypothetical protein VE548_07265 [Nitrososphaeraceae archaeon]|nr:hypothetical protein [Nitrososphaeraceae archaeon]
MSTTYSIFGLSNVRDLQTLREMYSRYTKYALYDGNEIVVILPFYETAEAVRRVLSEDDAWIDVRKCEKEQALLIIDSLQGFKDGLMLFVLQIASVRFGFQCVNSRHQDTRVVSWGPPAAYIQYV